MNRSSRLALWGFLIAGAFLAHAAWLNCPVEDAFITFRFASNLSQGHGLVWNVGEAPVEGYTNFLWLLSCALALGAGFSVLPFAQAIGVLAGLLTLLLTYRFASKILDCTGMAALLPCILLALSGPFAAWSTSGMETVFFGLLVLAGCYFYARSRSAPGTRDEHVAFLMLFLATLTRPEGFIVFTVLLATGFLRALASGERRGRDLPGALFFYVLPLAVYLVWKIGYFGSLLPNTYYAKTGNLLHQTARGVVYALYFTLFFVLPLLFPFLSIIGWRRQGGPRRTIRRKAGDCLLHRFGACLSSSVLLVYTAYIVMIGGDYMAMFRFFVPVLPFLYLLFGLSFQILLSTVSESPRRSFLAKAFVIPALVATLLHSTPLDARLFPEPPNQHGLYRGVETERWHVNRLSCIGRFFRAYRRSSRESLVTEAIGAISYYSDMVIYDPHGLVDRDIARSGFRYLPGSRALPGHEKTSMLLVLRKDPDYIMVDRKLRTEPAPFPEFRGGPDLQLRGRYGLKSVWLVDEENHEEGYFTFLERLERNGRSG